MISSDQNPGPQNLLKPSLHPYCQKKQAAGEEMLEKKLPKSSKKFHITNGLLLLAVHSQTVNLVDVSPPPKKKTSTNTNPGLSPLNKSPFHRTFAVFVSLFLLCIHHPPNRVNCNSDVFCSAKGATRIIIKSLELAIVFGPVAPPCL